MFNPDSISQGELHARREAAERAWDDDTRNPNFQGHPNPAAGQCYVTSRWLQKHYGGYVGRKEGHFFWLSPDLQYGIDLTGDLSARPPVHSKMDGVKLDEDDTGRELAEQHRQYRPGPPLYKHISHPLFQNYQLVEGPDTHARSARFTQRADHELSNSKTNSNPTPRLADDSWGGNTGWGGDAFPAEQSGELQENVYWHDEPNHFPDAETEYKFVFANGQLHVSPIHDHTELAGHTGIQDDYAGPIGTGYAIVKFGRVTWLVDSNVHAQGLFRILKDYTKQVGWQWAGMTGLDGEPISDDFAPKKSYYFHEDEVDHAITLAETRTRLAEFASAPSLAGHCQLIGSRLHVEGLTPHNYSAFRELAQDKGWTLYAGDNVIKRIEDLEGDNLYSPNWVDEEGHDYPAQDDDRKPGGVFKCPACSQLFPNWGEYMLHRRGEEPRGDLPKEDGKFPELPDLDNPMPANWSESYPQVMPVASVKEARRVDGFDRYAQAWNFEGADANYYVAYLHGSPIGYGAVTPEGEVLMIHAAVRGHRTMRAILAKMQLHYGDLTTVSLHDTSRRRLAEAGWVNVRGELWKWSQSDKPRDMIQAPVPFIYDIQEDKLYPGQPGQRTSDIPGQFTPGGIVEGTYEPGGKVVVHTMTNMPWTARHLLELWYYELPHMEVTGLSLQDAEGKATKLAGYDIGGYISALVAADPAASVATQSLRQKGGRVLVVGGAVRDALLGKEPKDVDLLVSGIPSDEVRKTLERLPGRVDLTGKAFGVYRYRNRGHEVEVALPRSERSSGQGHRDFDVQADHTLRPEDDLYRRDFTANAMAVDVATGELIDPFGGLQDTKDRKLKTLNDDSLRDDPLRTVRALVANSRHGLEPDDATRRQMGANASGLLQLPADRIFMELEKLFSGNDPASAIRLAHETGVLQYILPEVDQAFGYNQNNPHHELELGEHLLSVLQRASQLSSDPDVRLAALLHDIGKPASAWVDPATGSNHYYEGPEGQGANHEDAGAQMAYGRLKALRYPADRATRIRDLVAGHMFGAFNSEKGARRFLNQYGDLSDDLLNIRDADQGGKGPGNPGDTAAQTQRELLDKVRLQNAPTQRSQLALNGRDLIEMGIPPGPEIGRVLEALTQIVVEAPELNQPDILREKARALTNV